MNNYKMQKVENGNFHNGMYILGKENIEFELRKIKNPYITEELENMDCPYDNAYIFLKGICHIFAFALHTNFGYEMYEIISEDGKSNHSFCKSNYQGKDIYIDVRGATTEFKEFFWEFRYMIGEKYNFKKYESINSLDFRDEWEDNGFKFANAIIAMNLEIYSLQHK